MAHIRLKRRALPNQDREQVRRVKAITSDDLAGGGKVNPGHLGESGVLPEAPRFVDSLKDETSISKIEDARHYRPSEMSDAVLRDDLRIVLAWYATLTTTGEFKYDLPTIHNVLTQILQEAKRRGPAVVMFDPKGMKDSVRDFFLEVAQEVGIPPEQFRVAKRVENNPGRLLFYIPTPENVRAKLTSLSRVVAAEMRGKGVEVEDVDHVTLLYLKGAEDFTPEQAQDAATEAKEVLREHLPIKAKLQGWAYFDGASKGGEPKTALVALLDAPGLESVYSQLREELVELTGESKPKHGFVPHATVAYLPVGARLSLELPVLGEEFDITEAELSHTDTYVLKSKEHRVRTVSEPTDGRMSNQIASKPQKTAYYLTALKSARKGGVVLELFAGTGRSECALKKDAEHLAVEADPARARAYRKKHPKAQVHVSDNIKFMEEFDVCAQPVTVIDFDASGSPFKAFEKYCSLCKNQKPVLALLTWGYVWFSLNKGGWNREKAWSMMKKEASRIAKTNGKEAKPLGWSWSTLSAHVVHGAFSLVDRGKPHLENHFESVDDPLVLERKDKRVSLRPDTDPSDMNSPELLQAHWTLHQWYRKPAHPGFSTEDLSNLHARVVDEMYGRGKSHPPPPDDGLDENSSDFENNAGSQPDYWQEPGRKRVRKDEFSQVNSSGNVIGREISLSEVLPHFKTFKARMPFVYLVGGLANNGRTKGDIDILIKEAEGMPAPLLHVIKFRIGRALPPELSDRVQFHLDKFGGPFTSHVELFDMVLERVNPKNEVKQMAEDIKLDREAIYQRAEVEQVEDLAPEDVPPCRRKDANEEDANVEADEDD